jgi:prolyl-tRNA synthetase
MVGGLVMCHGDDNGLRLPPRLAPVQVLVMVVKPGEGVVEAAQRIVSDLVAQGVRAELDDRVDTPFGRRAVDAELKGIPVRIEVGPRDLADGSVTVVRRIAGGKSHVALGRALSDVSRALDEDHEALYAAALAHRDANLADVERIEDAAEAARTGWATIPWKTLGTEGEAVLAESGVTVRCLTMPDGSVPLSEDDPAVLAVVGRAY